MKIIAIGSIITLILVVLFFYFDVMQGNLGAYTGSHPAGGRNFIPVHNGSRQCNCYRGH